ncbi:MAG: histidinol-phosphate transaminase [Clostridia bacterium]|nr:histidinol-phosphate transaminase [Clostridia bacterium]
MSRFFSTKYSSLVPYVPGEQPKDMKYIKLNTNESPFPPSQGVLDAVAKEAGTLQLYSDPSCSILRKKAAEVYGVPHDRIIMTNGSDEVLNFAFMAFCDKEHPIAFADITYGFYSVFAELNGIPYRLIPLRDDFSIDYRDYVSINENIVIANPNAPTGLALSLEQIEEIVRSNPNNVVIIDEAYVDFGAESAVRLTDKYDNLLVTQTFSKSRSMAGARLGIGIGNEQLISDLNTVKYSTNPYNVNRMTCMAGYAALCDNDYYMDNCKIIEQNREYMQNELSLLGFEHTQSKTNFVFAKSDRIDGERLYLRLKEKGILVRHFDKERISQYNRITVGTREQTDTLLDAIKEILKETEK